MAVEEGDAEEQGSDDDDDRVVHEDVLVAIIVSPNTATAQGT